jgi:hypothetical protein
VRVFVLILLSTKVPVLRPAKRLAPSWRRPAPRQVSRVAPKGRTRDHPRQYDTSLLREALELMLCSVEQTFRASNALVTQRCIERFLLGFVFKKRFAPFRSEIGDGLPMPR